MADVGIGYMPLDRQLFRRGMADALAELLAQRYGTAKQLARAVGIDVSTAENLRKGHLSVPTLQKVMASEGRSLWEKLGDELFGETFYQFEERRLGAAIQEAESVRSNLVRLRAQREKLLAGAVVVDPAPVGPSAGEVGRAAGDAGSSDDGASRHPAQGQGDSPAVGPVEDKSFAPVGDAQQPRTFRTRGSSSRA